MEISMKEIIINVIASIIATIIVTAIVYIISVNVIIAAVSLVMTLTLCIVYYYIRKYYFVCKVIGIKSCCDKKKENWKKHFSESRNIRIMLGRGGAVLGTDTDPLYLTLKELPRSWEGKIQVLILNPDSRYIEDRAKELGVDMDTVKNQCRMVMNNIKCLKEKYHVNIQGAYYDTKPFLRFTLFDEFGFFSYPAWGEKYEPFPYQFRIQKGQKTLYNALSAYFEQVWNVSRKEVE